VNEQDNQLRILPIDIDMFKYQKFAFIDMLENEHDKELEGLLHLLDAIQDELQERGTCLITRQ